MANVGSAAPSGLQQSLGGGLTERLSDRAPIDVEVTGQLGFGGKLSTVKELAEYS